jgi:hypothetical protein
MLCKICGFEESKAGACDNCRQDWDQAMEDLFDVLDNLPSEHKSKALEVVGNTLFKDRI